MTRTAPGHGRSWDGLDCHGWQPYGRDAAAWLIGLAVDACQVRRVFCDAGAGEGDRLEQALAAGCAAAYGIEHDPQLARKAHGRGLNVIVADVRDWAGYGLAGIVWVNCPFVRDEDEAPFEAWLAMLVRPGAVLVQVNDCGAPAGDWDVILDDRPGWRGVYRRRL